MTTPHIIVLGILFGSLCLFLLEKPRADVVALLVLLACIATGLITPAAAFLGFANPAVVTVWAVFILSGAISKTGVAEQIGRMMQQAAGGNPHRLLLVMMLTAGLMSAFMNNVGAVAILLPAVISMCRDLQIPPSKMLIPLAVASLLGGNLTLIGTPPNLIATALMQDAGIEPFAFFDFLPMGLIVLTVGIIYMMFLGHRLLPSHTSGDEISEGYALRDYLVEAVVSSTSPLVGKQVKRIRFGLENDIAIVYVRRGKEYLQQASDRALQPDDVLLLEGTPEDVLHVCQMEQLELRPKLKQETIDEELAATGKLVELTLAPRSSYRGKTLRELGFRSRFGVSILAIRHEGEAIVTGIVDVPLRFGDVLLAQGADGRIERLKQNINLLILDDTPFKRGTRPERARHAIFILCVTLLGILFAGRDHVSTMMLAGAVGMVLVGALTMEEAYASIDWKSVFLIAGMLPLGEVMATSGTAMWLADWVVHSLGNAGVLAVLFGLTLLASGLTNVISNAAAAVLLIPIAISTANGLGVNPQPFVMATVIASSSAFLLPIGHQANIIIYGPGGYRFADFMRVGVWLTLLLLLIVTFTLPLIWPL